MNNTKMRVVIVGGDWDGLIGEAACGAGIVPLAEGPHRLVTVSVDGLGRVQVPLGGLGRVQVPLGRLGRVQVPLGRLGRVQVPLGQPGPAARGTPLIPSLT